MRAADVKACVDLLAANPVESRRYGHHLVERLASIWRALLRRESMSAVVVEDLDSRVPHLRGFGISVFVYEEFLHEYKASLRSWIGPELARRVQSRQSPILGPNAIRHANSGDGLTVAVWAGLFSPVPPEERARLEMELAGAFMDDHLGYRLREVMVQPCEAITVRVALESGGFLWRRGERRYAQAHVNVEDLVKRPFVIGMTRELALQHPGAWIAKLFLNPAPRAYFRPAEQKLLRAALKGPTDEELSDELGVSLSFVKKTWRSIYDRVGTLLPGLPRGDGRDEGHSQRRGREKKQRVLAYLRDHAEELRPVLRRAPHSRSKVVRGGPRGSVGLGG